MDVSVIIPAYNAEAYLKKCLDSLLHETMDNLEVIVINDGSTDSTLEIIQDYQNKIKNYVIIDKKNGGQAVARNEALKIARGKYVFFLDSDDYLVPGALSKLYSLAIKDDVDIAVGDKYMVYADSDKRILFPFYADSDDVHKKFVLRQNGPLAVLIKRDMILENNWSFLENHIYEDVATIPALALYAKKILYTDIDLYNYYVRIGSTMNQTEYSKKLEDIFDSIENMYSLFEKENKVEEYRDELEFLFIEHLLHAASLRFFKFDNYRENIDKVVETMKKYFPNYKKNKYYKKLGFKYKLVCNAFYKKNYKFLKLVLNR